MSIECRECEADMLGPHDDSCSRAQRCDACGSVVSHENVKSALRLMGYVAQCVCGKTKREASE